MKYRTKKTLTFTKTWAEDELINTSNVSMYATPPKTDEKFTGIGFLIWHKGYYYMVENKNGKCKPLTTIPKGWKKIHKSYYDKHNAYLNHLRRKRIFFNLMQLKNPLDNVPSVLEFRIYLSDLVVPMFEYILDFRKKNNISSAISQCRNINKQITYSELWLFNQLLNDYHLEVCKQFEKSYIEEKEYVKNLFGFKRESLQHISHFDKDNEK